MLTPHLGSAGARRPAPRAGPRRAGVGPHHTGPVDHPAAWQAFKTSAQKIAVGRLGRGAFLIGGAGTNSEHVFDVSLGQAYALRALTPRGWRAAAAAAYTALVSQFHSGTPARWAAPRTLAHQSILGAEQPPPMPFFDRGSWEQLVALGP
jgi:hypothetical protein